jgi:hypothetical protein
MRWENAGVTNIYHIKDTVTKHPKSQVTEYFRNFKDLFLL